MEIAEAVAEAVAIVNSVKIRFIRNLRVLLCAVF